MFCLPRWPSHLQCLPIIDFLGRQIALIAQLFLLSCYWFFQLATDNWERPFFSEFSLPSLLLIVSNPTIKFHRIINHESFADEQIFDGQEKLIKRSTGCLRKISRVDFNSDCLHNMWLRVLAIPKKRASEKLSRIMKKSNRFSHAAICFWLEWKVNEHNRSINGNRK